MLRHAVLTLLFAGAIAAAGCDADEGDDGADSGTDSDADADSDSDTDSEDTDACSPVPTALFFREYSRGAGDYAGHQVLMKVYDGGDTDVDPTDGSWTVLLDEADLAPDAEETWRASVTPDLMEFWGVSVRFAFRYTGDGGDDWFIDDLCIAQLDDTDGYPEECEGWADGFDDPNPPVLPDGWIVVAGDGDGGGNAWQTTEEVAWSIPNSATVVASSAADLFLVKPAEEL
jgi:hypothetical protein